jgi:hypothetical protein
VTTTSAANVTTARDDYPAMARMVRDAVYDWAEVDLALDEIDRLRSNGVEPEDAIISRADLTKIDELLKECAWYANERGEHRIKDDALRMRRLIFELLNVDS